MLLAQEYEMVKCGIVYLILVAVGFYRCSLVYTYKNEISIGKLVEIGAFLSILDVCL